MEELLTKDDLEHITMGMAEMYSAYATCNRLKVGAVIVNKSGEILGAGYNTAPAPLETCEDIGCCTNEEGHCYATIHAEQMAMLSVAHRKNLIGAKMFVTHYPCENCSKLILHSGIEEVVYLHPYENEKSDYFLQHINVRQLEG